MAFIFIIRLFLNNFSKNLQGFEAILFYFSDISVNHIQVFASEKEKGGNWDYRGYALSESNNPLLENINKLIAAYDELVLAKLSYTDEQCIELYEATGAWPDEAEDNPIYNEELPEYLVHQIVQQLASSFSKQINSCPWKHCYLDFFPESDFYFGQLFDLMDGQWNKVIS